MSRFSRRLSNRSRRALLTTCDQSIFSLSNFAVAIAIARIAGPVGLGSYSLAYALWLGFQALHRALITDPMAIANEASHPGSKPHVSSGLASELILGLVAAAVFAVLGGSLLLAGQHSFGLSLVSLAPWVPALLVQDYWRWIGFMRAKPGKALANDVVFDTVQGALFAGLIIAGLRSPAAAISAWGAGAAAGAALGLHQFSVRPSLRGGIGRLKRHWPVSRWLSANGLTSWGSSQSYAVLTAAILGPVGVGALRAAQTLVGGVALVLLQSGGSLGLPEASRALHDRGMAGLKSSTRFITVAAVVPITLLAVLVAAEGNDLLRLFYGPAFGRYWTAATIIAFSLVASAWSLGSILTLKATRQTRVLFWIIFGETVVTVVSITVLSAVMGVTGAAIGIALGNVTGMICLLRAQNRTWRDAPWGAVALADRLVGLEARIVAARHQAEARAQG